MGNERVIAISQIAEGAEELTWSLGINVEDRKDRESFGKILDNVAGVEVTIMNSTFEGCANLKEAPEIPESVVDMSYTFYRCTKLTGVIAIHANPQQYQSCFGEVNFDKQRLVVEGSSTMRKELCMTAME